MRLDPRNPFMAFCEFKNVRIAGVSAGVPKNIVSNLDLKSGGGEVDCRPRVGQNYD